MPDAVASSPELTLAHLDSLPTLPAVALKLLQATVLDSTTLADIVRLLRADQTLTARVLSLAGSSASGVREPVTTLERAITLIGFSTIRSIVLAVGVFDSFAKSAALRGAGSFDRIEFWKHALGVACAARRLAQLRRDLRVHPEDAFVAGLLHDLGKVALDAVFPKAYDRIAAQANHSRGDIADFERAILGADHTIAGRRLAERWHLPRVYQETIWLHHLAADALPSSVSCPALIGLVQLADTLCREQRIGYSGNHAFYEMSPRLATRLGFSTEHVGEAVQSLVTDVAEQANLLGLDGETPQAVYVKAMTRANAELGRLNTDLLTSNRRLAAGARFFRAITDFEQHLTDWADPAAVVVAIAHAARTALQQERVAVFGLREGGRLIDLCWTSGSGPPGRLTQAVEPELAEELAAVSGNSGSTLDTSAALGRLIGPLLDQPDPELTALLPVTHVGQVAGGIIFRAEPGEHIAPYQESDELRSFLASLGLALGRANAQAAAQRLSEDLAETNRRLQQVQVELLRSRTLNMIAEMAAGAGHELNSPLSVISGRAQMLAARLTDPEARRALQAISEKAHECSGIVTELMDFARPRAAALARVDLGALLSEVRQQWLERSGIAPTRVRLDAPPAGTPTAIVRGDGDQLRTAIRELLANAVDAVAANNGTVVMRWQPALADHTWEVLVSDNGCGMSPHVLQRAFDPFFSHRSAGRGRGLGLPRAYRIIEAHGGRVWLESQPDEGTTAHVLLPRHPGSE